MEKNIIPIIILITLLYMVLSNIKKEKKLYNLAYIDPITGLGNFNFFIEKTTENLIKYNNLDFYMLMLDIKKFKSFNKKYGHEVGKLILESLGNKLSSILPDSAIVARFSSDVFGVLLTSSDIDYFIDIITDKTKYIVIGEQSYSLQLYIGVYKLADTDFDAYTIIDKSKIALELAKEQIVTNVAFYNSDIEKQVLKEQEIESIMEQALLNNEFKVFYQPKIDLNCPNNICAEALVRWYSKNRIISPSEFIPLFEKSGFILKLDLYIFEEVCKDLVFWKSKYNKIPHVSVNVSKEHFYVKDFIVQYAKIVKKYGLINHNIELEITESATVNDNIDIFEIIRDIKKQGFLISIDDFGTGYSSLSMLQSLNIDTIKIDKSFVDVIDIQKPNKNIIQDIIFLAHKLGLKTVAEGVENKAQLDYLKGLNCDFIQGYYFSKPLEKEDFEQIGKPFY